MEDHLLESNKLSVVPTASLSNREVTQDSNTTHKQETSKPLFADYFLGYIDKVSPRGISGWVLSKSDLSATVVVMLKINGRHCARVFADLYREDVHQAGHAEGKYGFEFDFTSFEPLDYELCGADLAVQVASKETLAEMHRGRIPSAFESLPEVCKNELIAAFYPIQQIEGITDQPDNSENEFSPLAFANGIVTAFYRQTDSKSKTPNTGALPMLSPYVIYTRDRLNKHKVFDYESDPRVAIDLLIWYLEDYGFNRQPYKAPLSNEEINYCNELILFPDTVFCFSRLHYYFLLKYKPELNIIDTLNSEKAFCDEIYDWVEGTCTRLNIVDICVPTLYIDRLSSVPAFYNGKEFPLSCFFKIKWNNLTEYAGFDLSEPKHRGCLYLMSILDGVRNTNNARFIPEDVKRAIFSPNGFLKELDLHILEPVYKTSLNVNRFKETVMKKLAENGVELFSGRCLSRTVNGDRHEFSNPYRNHIKAGQYDVQLIGPLDKASGLGQATRLSASILDNLPYSQNIVNFDLDNPAPKGPNTNVSASTLGRSRVNIIHLNAESIPLAIAYNPDVFTDSYNIGYFFWELDTPALSHKLALDMLDEIWVCSEYGVKQYKDHCDKPVVNVGMTYGPANAPAKEVCKEYLRDEFGLGLQSTVFLTTFDSFSFVQRKNPISVIRAFKNSFTNEEDVILLIKTQNKSFIKDAVQEKMWRAIDHEISGDERIKLINFTFKYDELLKFKKAADCYVSLHRSEGFGFGMIEAMSLGVPVIATNYSGNLEFCKPDNCWLIDASEKYLAENDYIFVTPGQKWAEPDILHAGKAMRECYENLEERTRKADRAKSTVTANFSSSAISERYKHRIDHIVANL